MSKDLADAIKSLVKKPNENEYQNIICEVSDIDTVAFTCTCTPIDGSPEFYDVKVNANGVKGFSLIPKDGSIVMASQTSGETAFITMVSEVDQIYLNGDNEDGLVKIKDLIIKLNNLENKLNTVIATFNTHTHPYLNVATPAVTSVSSTPVTGALTPTVKADLENEKIKHGSS